MKMDKLVDGEILLDKAFQDSHYHHENGSVFSVISF